LCLLPFHFLSLSLLSHLKKGDLLGFTKRRIFFSPLLPRHPTLETLLLLGGKKKKKKKNGFGGPSSFRPAIPHWRGQEEESADKGGLNFPHHHTSTFSLPYFPHASLGSQLLQV